MRRVSTTATRLSSRPASPLSSSPRPARRCLTNPLPDMPPDSEFESSDILGGALPVGRGRVAPHPGFSFLFKICALGVCTLFLLLAFRHGRTFLLRWKERHYKLYAYFVSTPPRILLKLVPKRSMRRRYGIPDHDQRPFNVAYAAARLAQEDKRKVQDRIRTVSTLSQSNPVNQGSTRTGALFHSQ